MHILAYIILYINYISVKYIYTYVNAQLLSCVQLFVTPQTEAHQAALSMGFPKQEYWSGLPFPSPGDLPDPRIELASSALTGRLFTAEPLGKEIRIYTNFKRMYILNCLIRAILWCL